MGWILASRPSTDVAKRSGCLYGPSTGAELDRLLDAFAAVEVESEADPECEDVAIDPCRILRYSWDSFQATDFTCSAPRLRDSEAHRIRLLIEELTDASRPAQ
jgi:hypothetical protein